MFGSHFDPSRQSYSKGEYQRVFETICLQLNGKLLANKTINSVFSGSTGNMVLIHQRNLICTNVGDSRAGVVSEVEGEWSLEMLSTDHTPVDPLEKDRVVRAGGRVHACFGKLA